MLRRAFLAALPLAAQSSPLRVEPAKPFPGSPILVSIAGGEATATWLDRPLHFQYDPVAKRSIALAAVGLEVKPGPQPLTFSNGDSHSVTVVPHAYRTGKLTVPPQFVAPPVKVQKRIEAEAAIKKRVFATRSARAWQGPFLAPADSPQTSPFGTRRTYNGKTRSIHQGLDFRAAVGTPIVASHAGRVLIAQEMYFEGGFVVIDHGEGLFSLYMHLSKFEVKVDDVVKQGDGIAESGSSGRVTGPHLHFGVQWQGLYMEPATLLQLRFGV